MDENILTGEAVPVRKGVYSKPAGAKGFDPAASKSCMLYGGTSVAQVGMQLDECSSRCADALHSSLGLTWSPRLSCSRIEAAALGGPLIHSWHSSCCASALSCHTLRSHLRV